jgi:hypothetical protein
MAGQSSYSRLAGDDEAAMVSGSEDYDSKKLRLLGYKPQLKRNLSYVRIHCRPFLTGREIDPISYSLCLAISSLLCLATAQIDPADLSIYFSSLIRSSLFMWINGL